MKNHAARIYREQLHCLWHARYDAEELGQRLSLDEEALRAECLEALWNHMTNVEQEELEIWIEANRPEHKPLDSDGWPSAPSPPEELKVVPVFMRDDGWIWRQGAPDGFRYILADEQMNDKCAEPSP